MKTRGEASEHSESRCRDEAAEQVGVNSVRAARKPYLSTMAAKDSISKYNRQNSNNVQLELVRASAPASPTTTVPMLQRQVSFRHPRCLFRQISKNTSMLMKCVVIVSLLFNVLAIPALAAVITLMFTQTCSTIAPPQAPDLMCYPCGEEGIPGVPGAAKTSNGYCCASKRDGDLQRLIQRNIIPSTSAVVQSRGCPDGDGDDRFDPKHKHKKFTLKTVAHLLVNVEATKTDKRLRWSSESSEGTAFLQGALQIENSTIKLKKGGIYRIQSHFSFDSVSNRDLVKAKLFDHSVYKINLNEEKIVLKTEKTVLEQGKYVSSDVDLNVKLREGEEIGVYLHTFRYLYELDIANTLDIEKIE